MCVVNRAKEVQTGDCKRESKTFQVVSITRVEREEEEKEAQEEEGGGLIILSNWIYVLVVSVFVELRTNKMEGTNDGHERAIRTT